MNIFNSKIFFYINVLVCVFLLYFSVLIFSCNRQVQGIYYKDGVEITVLIDVEVIKDCDIAILPLYSFDTYHFTFQFYPDDNGSSFDEDVYSSFFCKLITKTVSLSECDFADILQSGTIKHIFIENSPYVIVLSKKPEKGFLLQIMITQTFLNDSSGFSSHLLGNGSVLFLGQSFFNGFDFLYKIFI